MRKRKIFLTHERICIYLLPVLPFYSRPVSHYYCALFYSGLLDLYNRDTIVYSVKLSSAMGQSDVMLLGRELHMQVNKCTNQLNVTHAGRARSVLHNSLFLSPS